MAKDEAEFVVLRYMLSELRDEAATIGLVATTTDPPRVAVRFLDDPTTKSRADARMKRDVIDRFRNWLEREVARQAQQNAGPAAAELFSAIREHTGNIIRVSGPRLVLTDDFEGEVTKLFDEWVAPLETPKRESDTKARDPLGGLRKEASRAILREARVGMSSRLSKKVFQRNHEVRGQTHTTRFDLAIVPRGSRKSREHIFHHVLMLPDPEESFNQAAALCWRWEDVQQRNGTDRSLAAVLYSRSGEKHRGVTDAVELLEARDIKPVRLSDLAAAVQALNDQYSLV